MRFSSRHCTFLLLGLALSCAFAVTSVVAEGITELAPVLTEGARLPAGTVVEPLGSATLNRLNGAHPARRYRLTAVPKRFQIACNYVSGTYAVKHAVWELAVFDDPGGTELARVLKMLLDLRDHRRAEWLARWGEAHQAWESPPDMSVPLRLCSGPGNSGLVVIWAEGRFWEWTFQGFTEGGSAFGDGGLPGQALFGEGAGVRTNFREGFSAYVTEFRPLYLTAP